MLMYKQFISNSFKNEITFKLCVQTNDLGEIVTII